MIFGRSARSTGLAALLLAVPAVAQTPVQTSPAETPFVPVLRADFPDPFILRHGGEYLAYATNSERGRSNVQMAASPDLVRWTQLRDAARPGRLHDAMPTLPAWAKRGHTWAPEVLGTERGFVLYFTARYARTGQQCVGAATATDPRGPFVSTATEPLVCQTNLGGTIDASPFRDADGALYLYYKNDGNHPSARKPTEIWGQRMSADGLSLLGTPVSMSRNDRPWEAHVVEAPVMTTAGGSYQLFYSSNDYGWQPTQRVSAYATGYAQCRGPLGPCVDAPANPILSSRFGAAGCVSGPGHPAILEADGRAYIAYHGWAATAGCRPLDRGRHMYIAPLTWRNGRPEIGPTLRPGARR